MIKLTKIKKNGEIYYYAQMSIRDGKRVSSRTIKKIGKHSELLKITSDPESYALAEIKKIDAEYKDENGVMDLSIRIGEVLEETDEDISRTESIGIGYFYIQYILGNLKLKKFCSTITENKRIQYNPFDVHRFLIYSRVLSPGSKWHMWNNLYQYYEKPVFGYQDILRYMDVLAEHYDDYLEYLFDQTGNLVNLDMETCYYDCTNFYSECEREDEDYIDEVTGEIIRGLRKYGPSKEHRPNPIVEMGIFMDGHGIPLTMGIHSGSTNEQITAIPLERKLVKMFDGKPFIYCADAGLGSEGIRLYNSMSNRAFVVTQSLKKLDSTLKGAVFDKSDYYLVSDNKPVDVEELKSFDKMNESNRKLYEDKAYKVIPADKLIELDGVKDTKHFKNGNTKQVPAKATLKQYLLVTFSRKQFEYQRSVRNRQIERARRMLANSEDPEEFKKGNNDIRRFIRLKPDVKSKAFPVGARAADVYEIADEKIAEEEKYDGYYGIATNITIADSRDNPIFNEVNRVLKIMSGRYRIEEDFRIMKTDFCARPYYHRLPSRITAHFLLCYSALLVHRILETLLKTKLDKHFTIENILQTLRALQVSLCENKLYIANYTYGHIMAALDEVTGINLNRKNYLPKQLDRKIKKMF